MKKLYYLFTGIVVILVMVVACQESGIDVEELQTLQEKSLQKETVSSKMTKSDICHWDAELGEYFLINIADAAYDKHIAHGDKPIPTFYQDLDGDGFGNTLVIFDGVVCEAPEGYVLDNSDCDDTTPAINPGATEICDGIDNNCDGNIDEGFVHYSPEGSYTFRKVIDRGDNGIITGDYFVELSADDVNGDFSGTGVRYDIPNGGNAYVNITGKVDSSGNMTFFMHQWLNDSSKTGTPQNYWTIDGTVEMCDGISEIHFVSGKEGVHVFILLKE